MNLIRFIIVITLIASSMILSSCAVTTRATEGSSETFGNTSEASSKFSSSTFPNSDDEAKLEEVTKFARTNLERLRADMAVGHGEYLTALAILLEISKSRQEAFYTMTKTRYRHLFNSPETTAEELLVRLKQELVNLQNS